MYKHKGFTLIEIIITLAVISILVGISAPSYNHWISGYRLKAAIRNLRSNMQKARVMAISENKTIEIRFDYSLSPGFYYFDTNDDNDYNIGEHKSDLASFGSKVDFGTGNAKTNWSNSSINQAARVFFTSNGNSFPASIYLENENKDVCYSITTSNAGTIKIRKYDGDKWIN